MKHTTSIITKSIAALLLLQSTSLFAKSVGYTAIEEMDLPAGVVYQNVEILEKKTMYTDMFSIDTAGTYLATLTDFNFPMSMKDFGMSIVSTTRSYGSLLKNGSLEFAAEPGNYFMSFFGKVGKGPANKGRKMGQYGIEISMLDAVQMPEVPELPEVAAVPVPGALLLFGSGLLGLAGITRRKSTGALPA